MSALCVVFARVRSQLLILRYAPLLLSLALPAIANAAGLAITPPSVAADYSGTITVNITGLTSGQAVRVETFLDPNGNGAIDAGEVLVQSFQVADGQVAVIAGVRNRNVAGDDDGVANGQIQTVLDFRSLPEISRVVARYILRVSPSAGGFTPVSASFSVTQPAGTGKVTGKITSSGTPVAGAFAVLLRGSDGNFFAGTATDAGGNFTLHSVPGTYLLAVVKGGYVFDFETAATVTITAGATTTQNLSLIAGDRTIAGRLVDSVTGAGIPGVQIFAESNDDRVTLLFTDADGNFALRVSAGVWSIGASGATAALLGYVSEKDEPDIDARSGGVSGVSIQWARVSALIYGSIKDPQNNPLARIGFYPDSDQYESEGHSDANGNYVVGVTPGSWWVGPDNDDLGERGYLGQATRRDVDDGQALRVDFVVRRITAHVRGRVIDNTGAPVGNIDFGTNDGGETYIWRETDSNGYFDFGVFAGNWSIYPSSEAEQSGGFLGPDLPRIAVVDGVDQNDITYVVQRTSAQITGSVRTNTGNPIADIGVSAALRFNQTDYGAWVQTDASGNYALRVFNGTWDVGVDCGRLNANGYMCVSNQSVHVSGANRVLNFTAYPLAPLEVTTQSLPDASQGTFYSAQLQVSGGAQPYTWSLAPGSGPLPPGLNISSGGFISGTPISGGTYNFTVRVSDHGGHTADRSLAIAVATQPLQITTGYLSPGQVGVSYSAELQASGGQPPYTWSLTPGSGPLPPGLNVSGSTISGTPTTYGYFSFFIRVTDSASSTVDRSLSISINAPPFQMITTSLPDGRVGSPYQAQLEATGGVLPYYWSLAPGSLPLPAGLDLSTDGSISGTPTTEGAFSFIVHVTDSSAQAADRGLTLVVLPPLPTPTDTATPTPTPTPGPCVGDCSGDGYVTVDELIKGVNIALGLAQPSDCPDFNCNDERRITVDCLVGAVNAALHRCVRSP